MDLMDNMPFGEGGKCYATLPGYGNKKIEVLFMNEYEAAKLADIAFEESAPQATARATDAEPLKQNDLMVIGTTTFKVSSKQPDGDDLTTIILKK